MEAVVTRFTLGVVHFRSAATLWFQSQKNELKILTY